MNKVDDARIEFYLRHQKMLEEWLALGPLVASAADRFLISCADLTSELATEEPVARAARSFLEGRWPSSFLFEPSWASGSISTTDELRVAVGLQWNRTDALRFASGGKDCVFVGVWVNQSKADGSALSKRLRQAFLSSGLLPEAGMLTSPWWPAYRYQSAHGEYWNDLSAYRSQIADAIRMFWDRFAPVINGTLSLTPG